MRVIRRTTLICVGCVAVLAGLGLSRKVDFTYFALIPVCVLLILRKSRNNIITFALIIFLGLALGLWRGSAYMEKLSELKRLSSQKVTITATATSDSVYSARSQIEFTANNIYLVSPAAKPLSGSFKISGFGVPMVYRGDRIQVSGKLFPTRGANQGRMAYAKLELVQPDSNWVNAFTRRFSAGAQSSLPEPNASFGLGLLIGQRNNLPSELTNQLIMVGLVHIVAVSGYNLTILVRAVGRLKLGSKYQQLLASLALIIFFLLMTGFSASIVRAAIISILSLWAWYYGRQIRPLLIVLFTAALTAFVKPYYAWSDLGWYLSFLAFFGVLLIAPLVSKKFFRRRPKILGMVVLETLCAELMTLPLILMTFGQLSLIGLLANALVVPLIPFAMLFTATAAFAGMLLPAFAGWLAWPANILLTYILDVVKLFAAVPGIFQYRSIGAAEMVAVYSITALAVFLAAKRSAKNRQKIINQKTSRERLAIS